MLTLARRSKRILGFNSDGTSQNTMAIRRSGACCSLPKTRAAAWYNLAQLLSTTPQDATIGPPICCLIPPLRMPRGFADLTRRAYRTLYSSFLATSCPFLIRSRMHLSLLCGLLHPFLDFLLLSKETRRADSYRKQHAVAGHHSPSGVSRLNRWREDYCGLISLVL